MHFLIEFSFRSRKCETCGESSGRFRLCEFHARLKRERDEDDRRGRDEARHRRRVGRG